MEQDSSAYRKGLAVPGALLAVAVILPFLLGFTYSGFLRFLAELEFRFFGRWHPAITVLAFAGLFAAIWRLVSYLRRRRRGRESRTARMPSYRQQQALRGLRMLQRSHLVLLGVSALAAGIALASAVHLALLPRSDGSGPGVAVRDLNALRIGPVRLSGAAAIGPVSRYREGILGIGPDQFFIPIRAHRTPVGPEFDVFAEVTTWRNPAVDPANVGVLRLKALPGELVQLYRANGYRTSEGASVVFLNDASSRRGTVFLLFESLVGGAITLVFALLVRAQTRRAQRRIEADSLTAG